MICGKTDKVLTNKIVFDFVTDNQTDGENTRIHGWCQAGMSAQYTSDGNNIMLGAPGSYNWTGGCMVWKWK